MRAPAERRRRAGGGDRTERFMRSRRAPAPGRHADLSTSRSIWS